MSEEASAESVPSEGESPVLTATPGQLFIGFEIGLPTLEAICQSCSQTLREGARCTVYVYQPTDDVQWYTRGCYCEECTPAAIERPTEGTSEGLVHAVLGTIASQSQQTHRLCLTDITLHAYSPPTEGSEP